MSHSRTKKASPGKISSRPSPTPQTVKVTVTKAAAAEIQALDPKHQRQVVAKIDALQFDPYPADRRPMTDYPGVYRIDSGELRIGFTEHKTAAEHHVRVELVARRNDKAFYKAIKRRLNL